MAPSETLRIVTPPDGLTPDEPTADQNARRIIWRAVRLALRDGRLDRRTAFRIKLQLIRNPEIIEEDGTRTCFGAELAEMLELAAYESGMNMVGARLGDGHILRAIGKMVQFVIDNWDKIQPILIFLMGLL